MAETQPVKRTREERERQSMVSSSSSSSSSSLPALGSSQFSQKAKKPPPAPTEIINISDDSDDEPAPKAKPALKSKAKARKVSPAVSIVEISSDSDQDRRPPKVQPKSKVQPKFKDRPKSPIEIIDVDALDDGKANPPLPPHTESDSSSNRGGIPDHPIILDEPLFLDDPDEPLFEPPIPEPPSSLPDELGISHDVENEDDEMGLQANTSATTLGEQLDTARAASGVLSELSLTAAPTISASLPPPLPKKRPSQQSTTLPRIPRAQTPERSISIAVKGSPTAPSLPRKQRPRTPDQPVTLSVKASPGSPGKNSQVFFEDHYNSRVAGSSAEKPRQAPVLSSPNKGMQSLADAIVQAHASNNVRSPPKPIPLPRKTKGIAGKARATEHPSARAEGGRLINALKLLQEQSSPQSPSPPKSPVQIVETVENQPSASTSEDRQPEASTSSTRMENAMEVDSSLDAATQSMLESDTQGISQLSLATPEASTPAAQEPELEYVDFPDTTPDGEDDESEQQPLRSIDAMDVDVDSEHDADVPMAEVSTEDQGIDAGFPESVAEDFLPGSSHTSLRRSSRRTSPQISVASSSSSIGRFDSPHPSDTPEEQGRHLFLGGHRVCNWEDVRDEMRADPVYHLAENLPHALQDHINAMPLYTRMQPPMRLVFESMIRENTADDEPFAPPILIENFVDDQPTPDWEFYYTNKMWHGDGVPPPDMKGLECCDCSGSCAKNKDCACRQRQLRYANGTGLKDWMYDPQGRLRDLDGVPIFECNHLCRCDDDCRNRVVQNGRKIPIKIAKTEKKGWGVFYSGTRRIPKGTFVGIYAGEIISWEEAEMRGTTYDKWGRTYLFDLDFDHIKGIDDAHKYIVDAYHAGNFTRYLNHSCSPNCALAACYINEANLHKPLLAIFTCTDVSAGEELTFSYCGEVTEKTVAETAEKVKAGKVSDVHTPCHCGAALCNGYLFAA